MNTPTEILELDARNLLCPLPVIKTQDFAKQFAAGQLIRIVCTDPGAMHDIPTWCRINGHQVTCAEEIDKEFIITVQLGE